MQNKNITIAIIVLVLIVGFALLSKKISPVPGKACTMEAKLCPDGTAVGRSGPNCEFSACPEVKQETKVKISETILNNGVYITPQEIQDSRCSQDVQCIWAGELKVNITLRLEDDPPYDTQDISLKIGEPAIFKGKKVTLVSITPMPIPGEQDLSKFSFVFEFNVN